MPVAGNRDGKMTRAISLLLCLFVGTAGAVRDTITVSGIWAVQADGVLREDGQVTGFGAKR